MSDVMLFPRITLQPFILGTHAQKRAHSPKRYYLKLSPGKGSTEKRFDQWKGFPLPGVAFAHGPVNVVQDRAFFVTPFGGDQRRAWRITGNPVDRHVGRYQLQYMDHRIDVVFD